MNLHHGRRTSFLLGTLLAGAVIALAASGRQGTLSASRLRLLSPEEAEILSHQSIVYLDDGQGGTVKTLRISGINVQVVNGSGSTWGEPNGLGNLIVGYNEEHFFHDDDRTGSHNIVAGVELDYTSYGGLVVGIGNAILAEFATVTGGNGNTASAYGAAISGGSFGVASGIVSSISGGSSGLSTGLASSVSGGESNTASGDFASVSAGQENTASRRASSVSGGRNNAASREWATVSGGSARTAPGIYDWRGGSILESY